MSPSRPITPRRNTNRALLGSSGHFLHRARPVRLKPGRPWRTAGIWILPGKFRVALYYKANFAVILPRKICAPVSLGPIEGFPYNSSFAAPRQAT